MSFHDIQFPSNISFGSSGGPQFSTDVLEVSSGREERISKWNTPKRHYDVSYGIRSYADLVTVLKFYVGRQGGLNEFRYKDWTDFTSRWDYELGLSNIDQIIGIGDGSTTTFQLVKRYTSGIYSRIRLITKPISSTVSIAKDEVGQVSGWTVNALTGIVTFSVAPVQGVKITAGFEFDVVVRFEDNIDDLLSITSEDFGSGVTNINLVEVLDGTQLPDDVFHGGGYYEDRSLTGVDSAVSVTPLNGSVVRIDNGTTCQMKLPDLNKIGPGGPIIAYGGNYPAHDIIDHLENVVVNIPSNNMTEFLIGKTENNVLVWLGFGEETW